MLPLSLILKLEFALSYYNYFLNIVHTKFGQNLYSYTFLDRKYDVECNHVEYFVFRQFHKPKYNNANFAWLIQRKGRLNHLFRLSKELSGLVSSVRRLDCHHYNLVLSTMILLYNLDNVNMLILVGVTLKNIFNVNRFKYNKNTMYHHEHKEIKKLHSELFSF